MNAAALLLALAAFSSGQIVNILPRAQNAELGFSAQLEASADLRTGNTERSLFSLSAAAVLRSEENVTLLVGSGELGSKGGERFASNLFGHLRRRQRWFGRLDAEGFLQADSDSFRRLELRALAGAGLRLHWTGERASAALGSALMAENERLKDGGQTQAARWSSYFTLEWKALPNLTISQTTFIQPRLGDLKDARTLHEAALTARVSDRLRLPISLRVSHDTRPPANVKKTDVQLKTALNVRL